MKSLNFVQIAAFSLITAILISSCGIIKTNEFSKKKYTNFKKGESIVNIDHISKVKNDVDLFSIVPNTKKDAEAFAIVTDKPSQPAVAANTEVKNKPVNIPSQNTVAAKETRKVKVKRAVSFAMNRIVNKANTTSINRDGDGLSLFWLVILILLILWAIGLASGGFGLGGLINVLLVIALVLLILWLLEVV
jgi:hypothetical protein